MRAFTHLLEQGEGDTGTKELAHMILAELLDHLDDMVLDCRAVATLLVRDLPRGVVGVVDGIVNGDGDLEGIFTLDGLTSDTHPHRLRVKWCLELRIGDA